MRGHSIVVSRCTCPACRRPAKIFTVDGINVLRCTFEDCPTNANMPVPSMKTFLRVIMGRLRRELSGRD